MSRFRVEFAQQYKKYQWLTVQAEKHKGRDSRKESWRPDCSSIVLGDEIPPDDNWQERMKYALARASQSMEELYEMQEMDKTSLGVFKPKEIFDLEVSEDASEWKPEFIAALKQGRLWENRTVSMEPPKKVPWKFHYHFACDDPRCNQTHRMMIEDWEVGALYWREIRNGKSPAEAAASVRHKFFHELCGPDKNIYFYVGTILGHGTWVVIGVLYPKKVREQRLPLFDHC